MGLFDIFKRKKNNNKVRENSNFVPTEEVPMQVADDSNTEISQANLNANYEKLNNVDSYSNIISNEIIEKIIKVNGIEYISDIMIRRLEKYPKLVDLLLRGNISQEIISSLNYSEKLTYLPTNAEDFKFVEFFDLDEKTKKLVFLLNNRISYDSIYDNYQNCYVDLEKEFETVDFQNEINSLIPNIKINLGSETLTKTSIWSRFILYFPKSKYKIVSHNFDRFITGNIELNEETIIQMSYDTFRFLDESIIDKISNCKIVFSEDDLQHNIEEDIQAENEINYKLVKYNHLIYIIEKSSLNNEIKEKLLYKIKNMYADENWYLDLEITDVILPFLENIDIEEIKKITKEFELNIDEYIKKKIEKPAFNANYYIDEVFSNFDSTPVSDVINLVTSLPEDLKFIILKEPRVLKKLNISDKLDENELKKLIYLLSTRLSTTTRDFISILEFDIESFMSDPSNDYKSSFDINPIISKYGIFDYLDEEITISIADLLGHDEIVNCEYYKGTNILYTFENFFEKNGDGYHTRSLGLLEYDSGEKLIKELEKRNRDTTDMRVRQLEDGKYIVSGNGLHRFTVLRFHYLLDCMKKEKSEEELRELYKIPVNITSKTNFKKTYCNYLIQKANQDISFISFDNQEDKITIYYKSGDKSKIITEEVLLNLAIQSIDMLDSDSLLEIQYFYNSLDTFHSFIDMYIPNLLDKFDVKSKEGIKL